MTSPINTRKPANSYANLLAELPVDVVTPEAEYQPKVGELVIFHAIDGQHTGNLTRYDLKPAKVTGIEPGTGKLKVTFRDIDNPESTFVVLFRKGTSFEPYSEDKAKGYQAELERRAAAQQSKTFSRDHAIELLRALIPTGTKVNAEDLHAFRACFVITDQQN